MNQQVKSKYNKFNHPFYILWDFIKYTFFKTKKDSIKNTTPLNIMSFNLKKDSYEDNMNCWQYRKDDVVDFILNEKSHIVGMQEVMPHMFKYLISKLGYQYDYYGINSFVGGKLNKIPVLSSLGNCIIWDKTRYICFDKGHFWLSDTPNEPSATWGNTENRCCVYVGLHDMVTKESYYVFNTHLDHIADNQQKMVDLIASRIKDKMNNYNIVFMGDLNVNFSIPEDRHKLDSLNIMLTSTYNHIKDLTFNAWHPKLSKTLDAIYFNMNDVKCKVIQTKLSDHLPIVIYKV
jgi:endonuclease/exonuclease/phosphatase family metal-dependent hydrolase